jgi:hypothetical protein
MRALTLTRAQEIRTAIRDMVDGVEILPTLDADRPVMLRIYERDGSIYEFTTNHTVRYIRSLYL